MRRVLLDQNVPRKLRNFLPDDEVFTAFQMGWSTLVNGHLIAAASEAKFDILITGDKNIPHQNHLDGLQLALVVLTEQRWQDLKENGEIVQNAVANAEAGTISIATIPRRSRFSDPFPQKRRDPS